MPRAGEFSGGEGGGGSGGGARTRERDYEGRSRGRNIQEQGGGSPRRPENVGIIDGSGKSVKTPVDVETQIINNTTPVKSQEELASEAATKAQMAAIAEAKKLQMQGFQTAQEGLSPYAQLGGAGFQQWAKNIQAGAYTPQIQPFKFEADPSYQFRLAQGEGALQSSAAVRGGALSGAALKELAGYGQQMASQEYGNAYNRYLQQNQLQQQAGQQAFQQGSALAGMGFNAQNMLGNIGMAQGQSLSDLALQGGNVQAAGHMAPIDIKFQQQQLANAQQQMANQNKTNWLGLGGALLGGIGGFMLGGPGGAIAGAGIGSQLFRN